MADVETLVRWFEQAEHATIDARQESERDRDYVDGKQLTAQELETLRKRGQPKVVINKIRKKVNWLRGMEVRQRSDPKAFPRTPGHEQGAEAATDSIRFVCDNNEWDQIRSDIYDNMIVEGFGGVEVVVEQKDARSQPEIILRRYAWDRLFYDPHSTALDFSDARYVGGVIWQDAEELKGKYPDEANDIQKTLESTSHSDTYDDRPRYRIWSDTDRKRVRVVLIWYKEDDIWKFAKYHQSGTLEEGESGYVDDEGQSVCPLLLQATYCDRDNDRYGVVRDMIDPQDEVNKRRSKALHLLNSRQTLGEKGVVDNIKAMKREMARPDGHVVIEPDMRFEILQNNDLAAGQFQLLQQSDIELDDMGANQALSGDTGASTSGRAVLARQQGGAIELAADIDQLHRLTKRVYRHIWMRIRQFWTAERWVRVTDNEKNVRFVGLNRPITLADALGQMPEEEAIAMARQMGLRPGDERLSQVVGIDNSVEQMDVDISIDEVPDQVTLQGETFDTLVNLATSMPGAIPPEILIMSAPGLRKDMKDQLLEMMQQQQAATAEAQQATQPMQEAAMGASIEKTAAEALRARAQAAKAASETAVI